MDQRPRGDDPQASPRLRGSFLEIQDVGGPRPSGTRPRGHSLAGQSPSPSPSQPLHSDQPGASRAPPTGILHHAQHPETSQDAGSPPPPPPPHQGRHHHGGESGGGPHGRHHAGAPRHRGGLHHRADASPEEPGQLEAGRSSMHRAHTSSMRFKDSDHSPHQSRVTIHSRSSHGSSRIHPKGSGTWEDEKVRKRKGKLQRIHKKTYTDNLLSKALEKLAHILWSLRNMVRSLTQALIFETLVFLVVCLNTIVLVAQTFAEVEIRGEWYFLVMDCIFLSIYILEAVLKIIALGVTYFYDPWNNLDFFIMAMALLDFMFLQINSLTYSFYNHSIFRILKVFKSLRALRALRVLRRLSILTSLQEVTGTLARTLPSITAILILMFTCIFLFSVVLRALFRQSDPKRFQSILTTIFTLFTLLTLDDWSLIYLDSRAQGAWYIIPILMIYIIIQYFIFLNLVIAVLVDNFQMALLRNLEKVKQEKAAQIHEKLLEDSLTELRQSEPEEVKSESTLGKEFIEKKFGNLTERQKELQLRFLQLVAAVEQQQQKFRSQASIMDELVDTAFEAGEEDFSQ